MPYLNERDRLGRLIDKSSSNDVNAIRYNSTDRFGSPSPVQIRDLSTTMLTAGSEQVLPSTSSKAHLLKIRPGLSLKKHMSKLPAL